VNRFDRAGIAERLRGLLGGPDRGDFADTATRLGLEEVSLRMSIDTESPHPTVEVLAAVVREYGVDPTWLLTGKYDAATHRHSMDSIAAIRAMVRAFLNKRSPIAEHTDEHNFRGHGQN
jgi:hypothetical protein